MLHAKAQRRKEKMISIALLIFYSAKICLSCGLFSTTILFYISFYFSAFAPLREPAPNPPSAYSL